MIEFLFELKEGYRMLPICAFMIMVTVVLAAWLYGKGKKLDAVFVMCFAIFLFLVSLEP